MSVPKTTADIQLGYENPEGFTVCLSCAPPDAAEWDDYRPVHRGEYEWPVGFTCRDCSFEFYPERDQ